MCSETQGIGQLNPSIVQPTEGASGQAEPPRTGQNGGSYVRSSGCALGNSVSCAQVTGCDTGDNLRMHDKDQKDVEKKIQHRTSCSLMCFPLMLTLGVSQIFIKNAFKIAHLFQISEAYYFSVAKAEIQSLANISPQNANAFEQSEPGKGLHT